MKRFLDSSVLVEACLRESPKFSLADRMVAAPDALTSAHALAETYATLPGDPRLKFWLWRDPYPERHAFEARGL